MHQETIDQLISIGRVIEGGGVASTLRVERAEIMLLPDACVDLADKLDALDLKRTIMAIVHLERSSTKYLFGSVSPAIYLFRIYVQLVDKDDPELGAWIIANTDNAYLPWGTLGCHARSLFEYEQWQSDQEKRRKESAKREAERQAIAHSARLERERVAATEHLPNAIRRRDIQAVKSLLSKGADASAVTRSGLSCIQIAADTQNDEIIRLVSEACKLD